MASTLTPVGIALKWAVIPLALAALGYFVVGPKVGGAKPAVVAPAKRAEAATDSAPAPVVEATVTQPKRPARTRAADAPAVEPTSGPTVDISVQPDDATKPDVSVETPHKRRRKRPLVKKPIPKPQPPKSDNPADEGSVAGAQTGSDAGSTTGGGGGDTTGGTDGGTTGTTGR